MLSEKYQIIEQLGNQRPRRFGTLYLVKSVETAETAILKVVDKRKSDQTALERLRNESRFSFNVQGLPNVIEFAEDDSIAYLIRSYQQGEPIDAFWKKLRRKAQLPFLIEFLKQFSNLLNELKEKRIVHGDIKPGNILVFSNHNGYSISLLDFGLALKMDELEQRNLLFPLGYAAPELVLNHLKSVDHRTDYFALGILIWRLFAGKMPLTHPNPSIFTNLQLTHPLPDHASLPKGLHPLLEKLSHKYSFEVPPNRLPKEVVMEKITRARNARYAELTEFIADLEQLKPQRFWF